MNKNPTKNPIQKEYQSPPVGHEISAGLSGIKEEFLLDSEKTRDILLGALNREGYDIRHTHIEEFHPGFTCAITISESHLNVHTYPEYNFMELAFSSCRDSTTGSSGRVYDEILKKLAPEKILYLYDHLTPKTLKAAKDLGTLVE